MTLNWHSLLSSQLHFTSMAWKVQALVPTVDISQCQGSQLFQRVKSLYKYYMYLFTGSVLAMSTQTLEMKYFVYDSSPSGKLPDEAIVQLTCLLRLWEDTDDIIIHIRNCATQPISTLSCGYYAIAAAVAICQGNEPTLWRYDHNNLIDFVKNGLLRHNFEILKPDLVSKEKLDLNCFTEHKRHCLCQNMSSGSMIQCTKCHSWYHQACVTIKKKQRSRASVDWYGPCCDHLEKKMALKRLHLNYVVIT